MFEDSLEMTSPPSSNGTVEVLTNTPEEEADPEDEAAAIEREILFREKEAARKREARARLPSTIRAIETLRLNGLHAIKDGDKDVGRVAELTARFAEAKTYSAVSKEEWKKTADFCRQILTQMERQPARYSIVQRMIVQLAIATISDTTTKHAEKQKAAVDVARLFQAFSAKKDARDDPYKEDASRVSKQQQEIAESTTRDLLKIAHKAQFEAEPLPEPAPDEPPAA